MHPERAARLLSILGIYLLVAALILRLISLVMTTWQVRMGLDNIAIQPTRPTYGQYQISPDGKQVIFAQQIDAQGNLGWFTMPSGGGAIHPTQSPQTDLKPFQVIDNQVYYTLGKVITKVDSFPGDTRIVTFSRSPDRKELAFAATWLGNSMGLYIISGEGRLAWLGDHEKITDIAWSPDGLNLAYIGQVNGYNQVFLIRRDGQVEHQITNDHASKSDPRWSPDGRTIAYISGFSPNINISNSADYYYTYPTPQYSRKYSIHLVGINGENPRQFVEDDQVKFDLTWGIESANPVLLYSIVESTQHKNVILYSLNPRTGQVRRVYPPQEITAFNCPATIQPKQTATAQIALANTGVNEAGVNLVMRASPQAFAAVTPWDTNVIQTETVQVLPGSTQKIDWPIQAQPGLFTHLSFGVNPNGLFAMDERRCVIRNTYYGLPNLSFLPLMLPLAGIGLVLCIPWLRLQKKARLWALYLAVPVLTLVILFLEVRLVGM